MGGEASKIRRSKPTATKKSATNRSAQHIISSAIKATESISCTDNLLNVGKYQFKGPKRLIFS